MPTTVASKPATKAGVGKADIDDIFRKTKNVCMVCVVHRCTSSMMTHTVCHCRSPKSPPRKQRRSPRSLPQSSRATRTTCLASRQAPSDGAHALQPNNGALTSLVVVLHIDQQEN